MLLPLTLYLAFTLVAVLALLGLLAQQRRVAQLQTRLDQVEAQLQLQLQGLHGLTAGSQGVDRRLHRLEAREQVLSQRQDTFESTQADERPYHRAIQLVQQGAGVRRLIEELELSESEADLILRLHGVDGARSGTDP